MKNFRFRDFENFFSEKFKGIYIFNAIVSMFKWDLAEVPTREIEKFLTRFGCCGIVKIDGKLVAVQISRCGKLDYYGYGDKISWVTGNGLSGESVIGEDCVVIYNNSMRFSDVPIICYISGKLEEADKTENSTLVLARLMPIFAVSDENGKKRVEAIIKDIENGKISSVVARDLLDDIATQGKQKGIDVIHLTDINNIDKLQYVVKFYDDMIRRICNIFGLPMDSSGKMAQLNIKETEGHEALSQIYPLDRLRARREAVEEVKKVFGIDCSVEFTEVWSHCESVMLQSNVENGLDEEQEGKEDNGDNEDGKMENNELNKENSEEVKKDE